MQSVPRAANRNTSCVAVRYAQQCHHKTVTFLLNAMTSDLTFGAVILHRLYLYHLILGFGSSPGVLPPHELVAQAQVWSSRVPWRHLRLQCWQVIRVCWCSSSEAADAF